MNYKSRMNQNKVYVAPRYLTKEEQEEISNGTIKRFEEYIKKQLEQSEEYNMEQKEIEMEKVELKNETTTQNKNPFDLIDGKFIKLEKDKAKYLLCTNWKVEEIKKFTDDKGNLKEQIEFSADVLSEDGVNLEKTKIFSTTSYNALSKLKTVFGKYYPNTSRPVLIRIKKMGEGKQTFYDVEEIIKQ